ncbi:zinc finger domain-containing protein [Streptomyces phytophilus]|uniref:zinc finger domain-containing protein n=1 Tax=Streptomyces phytophilus TaxID=722715 RepID=UPI0015F0412D|nr:hypothetical protein [Streptomyces phytophilus]
MTRHRYSTPMPDSLRHLLRAGQHPARAVACPWCAAAEHRPCVMKTNQRQLPLPHPARISAWVRGVACCPLCQVEPGVECHLDGRPLPQGAVHPARETEAQETT